MKPNLVAQPEAWAALFIAVGFAILFLVCLANLHGRTALWFFITLITFVIVSTTLWSVYKRAENSGAVTRQALE